MFDSAEPEVNGPEDALNEILNDDQAKQGKDNPQASEVLSVASTLLNSKWKKPVLYDYSSQNVDENGAAIPSETEPCTTSQKASNRRLYRKKMELAWCDSEGCRSTSIRETVSGQHNNIAFDGPATGQVTYRWAYPDDREERDDIGECQDEDQQQALLKRHNRSTELASVLLLVKRDDDELMAFAAHAVRQMTIEMGIQVLLSPELAAKLKHYFGVDNSNIQLYERVLHKDFGALDCSTRPASSNNDTPGADAFFANQDVLTSLASSALSNASLPYAKQLQQPIPDLVCTLGGDGLLMYASSLFPGPVPPILCIAGGSLGFLTPFSRDEMLDAVQVALGLLYAPNEPLESQDSRSLSRNRPSHFCSVFPGSLSSAPRTSGSDNVELPNGKILDNRILYGPGEGQICVSMRMRLDCRVINRDGIVRARYNVLNEVVIDRGSSPYLAQLECFCDDVHLTTVQADGIIFSTPTGSTAYSMAAGGSVVHPAVPAILVTPICPHVLSFRPMVFPDHVVIRCYVPDNARSAASVAFDGKHHRGLNRGDCVQVQMSLHPVPTINKADQTFDWLDALKRSFSFNSRVNQKPL